MFIASSANIFSNSVSYLLNLFMVLFLMLFKTNLNLPLYFTVIVVNAGLKTTLSSYVNSKPHRLDQIRSVAQSCPTLCDPMNHSMPGTLSNTNSRSSLRLRSIESVMPSSYLILCRPLLLLPPIPPSIRVFSSELTLCMRQPKFQL